MTALPPLPPVHDIGAIVAWVQHHLGALALEDAVEPSPRFRGGQRAADRALATFDVTGYAAKRNEVWPEGRRGASRLSPYLRHGLLTLRRAWDAVGDGPAGDVRKYRDELRWQEYARHVYARIGRDTEEPLRAAPPRGTAGEEAWNREMACLDLVVTELERDGWLVNQMRMWASSHWAVRAGADWRDGEDWFYTHLLDGSRAANRLGWQWTVGTATNRRYGWSRNQVERRAPGLCDRCPLRAACPIQEWPDDAEGAWTTPHPLLRSSPDAADAAGPSAVLQHGTPEAVWLTAESLGDDDPAAAANPDLPVIFVFDAPLLERLRLSGKRLVFLAQSLADLAERREVRVHLGAPIGVLSGCPLATTFAPVPGWRAKAPHLDLVEVHPWPWLLRPGRGPLQSFSAWSKRDGKPASAIPDR
jgi:deoxyribodipyrimidine photo-lyase